MRSVILFARYAVRAVLYRLWARHRPHAVGLEELFAGTDPECPIPVPDRQTCRPELPAVVTGTAILDTVAWLDAHGWANDDRGEVQRYAAWMLKARAEYEKQGAEIS